MKYWTKTMPVPASLLVQKSLTWRQKKSWCFIKKVNSIFFANDRCAKSTRSLKFFYNNVKYKNVRSVQQAGMNMSIGKIAAESQQTQKLLKNCHTTHNKEFPDLRVVNGTAGMHILGVGLVLGIEFFLNVFLSSSEDFPCIWYNFIRGFR